jgi:hypothetical protein
VETKDENEERVVHKVVDTLTGEFPQLPTDHLASVVRESVSEFSGRPVRDFIPVLVTKKVRSRLRGSGTS